MYAFRLSRSHHQAVYKKVKGENFITASGAYQLTRPDCDKKCVCQTAGISRKILKHIYSPLKTIVTVQKSRNIA
jgi:hypothetical protein